MAFPPERDMEIPILEEIESAGGQVRRKDNTFYQRVATHFPQLTPEDLDARLSSGQNKWINKIQWSFKHLVDKGELEIPTRGILRTTDAGKRRLGGRAVPPPPPPPGSPPPLTHNEVVQKVKEMGEMLGKIAQVEHGPIYKHDVVWRDNPYATPKLVVEVCDKGNLDKDIASLIWAVKNWDANGILVLFEDSDFHAAQRKLAQEKQIYPIKCEDILKLHFLLAGNIKAIKSIFGI